MEGVTKDKEFEEVVARWRNLSAKEKFFVDKYEAPGENYEAVGQAALAAIKQIANDYWGYTVFVVSHAATMSALCALLHLNDKTLSDEPGSKLDLETQSCSMLQIESPANSVKMLIDAEVKK